MLAVMYALGTKQIVFQGPTSDLNTLYIFGVNYTK